MRSTEVSDLRWPQLTLTLIWRNVKGHIQSCIDTNLINYPHSSQSHHAKLRLLTISLKSCEGCSSYDVITSWPDLTRPIFFHQKLRKGCPISYGKFQHDPPNGVASSSEKLMGGLHQPPLTGRGLIDDFLRLGLHVFEHNDKSPHSLVLLLLCSSVCLFLCFVCFLLW